MYFVRFVDHVPGQGSYVVRNYFGQTVHGPDTFSACVRFVNGRSLDG